MSFILLLKGILLGFSVAAPVGPIGVLCITRTINRNFAAGFISGLGAATADLIYGMIAGLGLTIISDFLIEQKFWMQLAGFVFLVFLGIKTILKKESDIDFRVNNERGYFRDYISTFLLTLTNPLTILFFTAVFALMRVSNSITGLSTAVQLLSGIFFGSVIWWFFLSGLTYKLKTRIGKNFLRRIDLITGIVFLFFGLFILLDMFENFI